MWHIWIFFRILYLIEFFSKSNKQINIKVFSMHAFQIKSLLKIGFYCFKCIQASFSSDKEICGLKQIVQKFLIAGNLIALALFPPQKCSFNLLVYYTIAEDMFAHYNYLIL